MPALCTASLTPCRRGEIALGVIIGRTSEAFDFFVYGIASVLVFPSVVFPFVDKLTGTLYAFAIFGLAFIARPIGSVIFMAVDRYHGRGVKLTIALFLLGGSTVAISFLPGYDEIGAASIVMLSICRIGQGLALGGAWDGLGLPSRAQRPQGKAGLVCDDPAARRTVRLHRRQRALRILPVEPDPRGFPLLGLALSVFRRVPRSTSSRSSHGCGWSQPRNSPICSSAAISCPSA